MKEYKCPRCGYHTMQKNSIRLHYNRKNKCEPILSGITCEELLRQLDNNPNATFVCLTCMKSYSSRQGLAYHKKQCTNEQADTQTDSNNKKTLERIEELQRELLKLQGQVSNATTNITNNNITNNTMNVIIAPPHINDFGQENIAHISDDFKKECLMDLYPGMVRLIEHIHFNEKVPENHNLKYKSTKQGLLQVKRGGRWHDVSKNTTLDEVIKKGYKILFAMFQNNMDDADLTERSETFIKYFIELIERKCVSYYDMRNDLFLMAKDNTFYMVGLPENQASLEEVITI